MQDSIVDDAYIFQRVVDNIWQGHGWSYNIDSHVNPITSAFYVVVLLVVKILPLDVHNIISLAYFLGLLGLGWGILRAFKSLHPLLALTFAIGISSSSVAISSWGMETSIFLACIVWSINFFNKDRFLLAGFVCAFAALSRPEGMALPFVLAFLYFLKTKTIEGRLLIGFATVVLPWLIISWMMFGQILPHSVSVKAIQHNIGWFKLQPSWWYYFLSQPLLPYVSYPLAALGLYAGLRKASPFRNFMSAILLFSFVQVFTYSAMQAAVGYFWYLAPGNLAMDLLIMLGIYQIGTWLMQLRPLFVLNYAQIPLKESLGAVMILAMMIKLAFSPFHFLVPIQHGKAYREAAEWIRANTEPESIVAVTEIGYVGYYSWREIRDIHGLIHKEALAPLAKEEWDWWFKARQPNVLVVHNPAWIGEPTYEGGWTEESKEEFYSRYTKRASFGGVDVYYRPLELAEKLSRKPM